jgi:peptidyl-prolyl cis-trans isomerase SurA
MQRAERVGIVISDQMLNSAITRVADDAGVKFEDLPELLAQDGIRYSDYRNELRRQLTMDQLRRIEVMGRIAVSTREIDHCLADLDDNMVINSDYNLSHILISIPDSATGAEILESEEEANRVYQEIQDGADFSEMAVRHSDSQAALEGGALGWLKGSELPTLFFDIMDTLEAGEVSPPVRNVSGFHIVKINELRSANQHSEIEQTSVRHILIIPNEIIDDATARQRLEEAGERIEAGEDFAELAKLMSDDPGSVNEGGDMGWTNPGTFVPEFEEVANNAEINVVSAPFRSQFGWHILEVLGRRTYDNTEDIKQNSCVNRIRNSKLSSETELWVRRLRDEAYVEIRI